MAEYERMHTVPAGYLAAFADPKAGRKEPHVWRFERGNPEPKCLPVLAICVSRNIYAVRDLQGNRDPVIEKDVLQIIDGAYCEARNRLQWDQSVSYDDCRALRTKEALAEAAKALGPAEDGPLGTLEEPNVKLFRINRRTVHLLNQVHLSNGERYAISSYDDARLRRFVAHYFKTGEGPVRRSDRKPVGSPL